MNSVNSSNALTASCPVPLLAAAHTYAQYTSRASFCTLLGMWESTGVFAYGKVRMYDTNDFRSARATLLPGHIGRVRSGAMSGDSKQVVFGSEDLTVLIWDWDFGGGMLDRNDASQTW